MAMDGFFLFLSDFFFFCPNKNPFSENVGTIVRREGSLHFACFVAGDRQFGEVAKAWL